MHKKYSILALYLLCFASTAAHANIVAFETGDRFCLSFGITKCAAILDIKDVAPNNIVIVETTRSTPPPVKKSFWSMFKAPVYNDYLEVITEGRYTLRDGKSCITEYISNTILNQDGSEVSTDTSDRILAQNETFLLLNMCKSIVECPDSGRHVLAFSFSIDGKDNESYAFLRSIPREAEKSEVLSITQPFSVLETHFAKKNTESFSGICN